MPKLPKILKKFHRDESGNFAIIGAILVVPIIATMGAAFDYSQAYGTKSKLQASADTATLAAARDASSVNEFYDLTEAYVQSNMPELEMEITPKTGPKSAELTIKHRYQTTFLAITGIKEIPIEVVSEVAVEKFNRSTVKKQDAKRGVNSNTADTRKVVAALKDMRDKLLRAVAELPNGERQRMSKRIREKFAKLIKKAESGQGADPIYIKR